MQYLYHKEAGSPILHLEGDAHRYIFKVRRHKVGERLYLRNLDDTLLYEYEVTDIDRRHATLLLHQQESLEIQAPRRLHIGWCMIDPKSIEKLLPSLNEMGVAKITFISCERSQKSFKLDFQRLQKILLNSSQQCGRSVMMELDTAPSLEAFLEANPQSYMLNFSSNTLGDVTPLPETIVVGCEGGFTTKEVAMVAPQRVVGFDTPLILKSESAVCALASKVLL